MKHRINVEIPQQIEIKPTSVLKKSLQIFRQIQKIPPDAVLRNDGKWWVDDGHPRNNDMEVYRKASEVEILYMKSWQEVYDYHLYKETAGL